MSAATSIEWTDATWNPIVGCSIVSPGCANCYAMRFAARRLENNPATPHYAGTTRKVNGNPVWTGKLALAPERILLAPLGWKKPRRVFVNSMGDLFHEDVPDEWIGAVFGVMALCPRQIFQVLTKRAKRMRQWAAADRKRTAAAECIAELYCSHPEISRRRPFDEASAIGVAARGWPLPNVHLGVSCEDQTRAGERIPDLLETPAAVRFVSAEPLLGPINFTRLGDNDYDYNALSGRDMCFRGTSKAEPTLTGLPAILNWVIAGGESGPGHRPMNIEWAEAIRQQCKAAGTAFFFKQSSALRSGQRGRASDELWAAKEFPVCP